MKYLKYEIASGKVTEVTGDEILQWFVACFETQGDVWTEMNRKDFYFGSRERIYANEKSVKELGLTYFYSSDRSGLLKGVGIGHEQH